MKKLLLLPLFLLLLNCKDEASSSVSDEKIVLMDMKSPSKKADMNYEAAEAAPASEQVISVSEAKIIKTANLKFESDDLSQSFKSIQVGVNKYKATISHDSSGKDYESVYRNLTIRIPNQFFDQFIADISQGVKHFDTKEISQQDVTEEYIDIESRMNSKKKLEERYLQLLSKANKVSEMLEIEKQLAEIREEIEAKEGQLKYMQNRVALSTIVVEMYTINASESGATVSYGGKIWNAIKEGFNAISNFMLAIVTFWPFILIFVIMFIYIRKRFNKKFSR